MEGCPISRKKVLVTLGWPLCTLDRPYLCSSIYFAVGVQMHCARRAGCWQCVCARASWDVTVETWWTDQHPFQQCKSVSSRGWGSQQPGRLVSDGKESGTESHSTESHRTESLRTNSHRTKSHNMKSGQNPTGQNPYGQNPYGQNPTTWKVDRIPQFQKWRKLNNRAIQVLHTAFFWRFDTITPS